MNTKLTIFFCTVSIYLSIMVAFGQVDFMKGYVIDNEGNRTECLIKNVDWQYNPTEFFYKETADGPTKKGSLDNVSEFGVYDFGTYIRAEVDIDRSSENIYRIDYSRNPLWSKERIFLKLLINGDAKLYHYADLKNIRFFFSNTDPEIKQLVYKKYLVAEGRVTENNFYQQQLYNDVKCGDITLRDLERVKYTKGDFEKYFRNYNYCVSGYTDERSLTSKGENIHFKITPGLNLTRYSMNFIPIDPLKLSAKFDDKINFRLGLETEFVLPYNRNKMAVLLEPTYSFYNSTSEPDTNFVKINFKSLELMVGMRYYFFLNEDNRFFVNAHFVPSFSLNFNSKIEYFRGSTTDVYYLESRNNFALGVGYRAKKFSIETRYNTGREMLNTYTYWKSALTRSSLVLGYYLK